MQATTPFAEFEDESHSQGLGPEICCSAVGRSSAARSGPAVATNTVVLDRVLGELGQYPARLPPPRDAGDVRKGEELGADQEQDGRRTGKPDEVLEFHPDVERFRQGRVCRHGAAVSGPFEVRTRESV